MDSRLKLEIDSLEVSTFETTTPVADPVGGAAIVGGYDPTKMTYCFVCPVRPIEPQIAY